MAQLAIKGHPTRGKEVIEILEMLVGRNTKPYLNGNVVHQVYHIRTCNNEIVSATYTTYGDLFKVFTLEEFLEQFPYKVGDKVTHNMGILMKIVQMYWDAECNVIRYDIQSPVDNNYKLKAMLAEHLQPYKEETMENKPDLLQQLKDYFDNTPREVIEKEWHEYDKYNEIGPSVEEYLEYVKSIKQPQYPKTYEECCDVLELTNLELPTAFGYKSIEIESLQQLLVCRNAYWKIFGEEMKLGKPWEPDFNDNNDKHFICYVRNEVWMSYIKDCNKVLVFPTEEMRDAFYKNFKELINETKELL